MKIPLANSARCAEVDPCCYETVRQYTWYETPDGYAATAVPNGVMYMHDLVVALHVVLPDGTLGEHHRFSCN